MTLFNYISGDAGEGGGAWRSVGAAACRAGIRGAGAAWRAGLHCEPRLRRRVCQGGVRTALKGHRPSSRPV